jgi:FAD synthase
MKTIYETIQKINDNKVSSKQIKEEITNDDIKMIRSIIKKDIAKMFFNLFKTRNIWGSLK